MDCSPAERAINKRIGSPRPRARGVECLGTPSQRRGLEAITATGMKSRAENIHCRDAIGGNVDSTVFDDEKTPNHFAATESRSACRPGTMHISFTVNTHSTKIQISMILR
jgi:hypothetical protein